MLKGILTSEDARIACEHRVAAIVVSNHGGRQLDGVSATIDALPEIVEAVAGRLEVLVDGGIRAVVPMSSRPWRSELGACSSAAARRWGLAAGGEEGARHVLELLRAEIELSLQLAGCRSPADLTPAHVARRP